MCLLYSTLDSSKEESSARVMHPPRNLVASNLFGELLSLGLDILDRASLFDT